jgi:quinone-modifying oxidoreductase subunit QmoC
MAIRANPKLIEELEIYGAQDVSKCYHCGNCSATCPFSKDPYILPRRSMRSLQMGLERKLESDLEPWLCYYCGECSEECPRGAEPGETMMSLRRWLTSRYDFTGISRLFYRSWRIELAAILFVAMLTGLGFFLFGMSQGNIHHYDGAKAFLPGEKIHFFDWGLAVVLLVLLATNCARMWWFTIGRDKNTRVPITAYIKSAYLLPLHFITQMRYAKCERKRPWVVHLILMLSYVTMLVLIMFFVKRMAAGPAIDWRVHAFGLAATVGLLGTTIFAVRGRIKKTENHYKHSHETDWMFLILLIVVAGTGILQFILHRSGLDMAANITYVVHLMSVVPMLGLEVPFSKWSHLAYRPLAMYFAEINAEAARPEARAAQGVRAPQAA